MTRMAGANPKIAAIFGGGDFGLKNDAVNNAAFQDRSALQMAATNADAKAAIGEKEAEAMVEAAEYGAAATRAQGAAAGQSAMFGGLSSGISSLAGGFAKWWFWQVVVVLIVESLELLEETVVQLQGTSIITVIPFSQLVKINKDCILN